MRSGNCKRLKWLKANPDLWRGIYSRREDAVRLHTLSKAMVDAGLYSPNTNLCDIHPLWYLERIRAERRKAQG